MAEESELIAAAGEGGGTTFGRVDPNRSRARRGEFDAALARCRARRRRVAKFVAAAPRPIRLLAAGLGRGFIRDARFSPLDDRKPTAETLRALLEDPRTTFLHGLDVLHLDLAPLWGALFDYGPHRWIRNLRICDLGGYGTKLDVFPNLDYVTINERPIDEISRSRSQLLPGIETSTSPAFRIAHQRLRGLQCPTSAAPALETGDIELPSCEQIVCTVTEQLLVSSSSILHVPPPKLAKLALGNVGTSTPAVAGSSVLRQLRSLALWDVPLSELDPICRASSLGHLEELEIHVPIGEGNFVYEKRAAEIRASIDATFPSTKVTFDIRAHPEPDPNRARKPRIPMDADSRDSDGRINAIDAWIYGTKPRS
ncbi:MAG: hypothetical protein QM831_32250 [Kofleriaceae bacterium]